MSRPALSPSGFVNTEPAFCPPGWLARRQRTISAMARFSDSGLHGFAAEGGRRHHVGGSDRRRAIRARRDRPACACRRGRRADRQTPTRSGSRRRRTRGRRRSSAPRRPPILGHPRPTRARRCPACDAARAMSGKAAAPPAVTVEADGVGRHGGKPVAQNQRDARRSRRRRRACSSLGRPLRPSTPVSVTAARTRREVIISGCRHEQRRVAAHAVGRTSPERSVDVRQVQRGRRPRPQPPASSWDCRDLVGHRREIAGRQEEAQLAGLHRARQVGGEIGATRQPGHTETRPRRSDRVNHKVTGNARTRRFA